MSDTGRADAPPEATSAELWTTAHHEAGHAVAAAVLGVGVEEVGVVPEVEDERLVSLGHCRMGDYGEGRDGDERNVLITLAGPAVDDLRGYPPDRRWFRRTTRPRRSALFDDWRHAFWVALRLAEAAGERSPRLASVFLRFLYDRARLLVGREPNWRAIEMLAHRLVRERTVGGGAVRQVLGAARGLARQEAVRKLRRLDVLPHGPNAFTLDRLLRALDECESGRRNRSAVRKELRGEWFAWWYREGCDARVAARAKAK
jgi:hypothetical protein